jgi:hypothetical protein
MTTSRAVPALDLYDIAFLAGGADRVVDTAVVALVESGRLRVRSPGELATVSLTRRHPVEAALLDAIGPAGHRSVDTVRWRVADDPRVLELGRRLLIDGLLAPGGRLPVPRRGSPRSRPTHAGRKALRALHAAPPDDRVAAGTSAMRVALGGRQQMRDRDLCTAVFEPLRPDGPVRGRRLSRRMREVARLRESEYAPEFRAPLDGPGA